MAISKRYLSFILIICIILIIIAAGISFYIGKKYDDMKKIDSLLWCDDLGIGYYGYNKKILI